MGLNRPSVTGGGAGTVSGVTAGSALSGGGTTGTVSVALDVSELSDGVVATADKVLLLDSDGSTQVLESVDDLAKKLPALVTEAAVDVSADYLLFLDGGSTGECKKEALTDLATALAGSGITASSGQLSITETGDISEVTAGTGLSGGGSSGAVSLAVDLSELSDTAIAVASDSLVFIDADDDGSKKESVADFVSGIAGSGLSASSGQLSVSTITSVGTISSGTWQGTAIAQAYIATDAINGDKIADDAIDSEHYTDGSIDTDHIADNQVTLAKMAGLARGKIIYGDASGDPAALAVGSANQVLTTDGTDIAWADASGGGSTDLNGLSAAVVDVAADSIGFIDADDSNNSKKESIADFISAVAGSGLAASSGQLTVSASATATAMTTGGTLTAADAAQQIIAMQVFS